MGESSDCTQARLTPLAIMVLGLLRERPMHPYEMYQTLISRREQRLANVRPGSLYHTVDRLLQRELLCVNDVGRAGNRPERTVYAITAAGSAQVTEGLADMLAHPVSEYPQIHLALAEAHELPADQVVTLLDQRLDAMRAELSDLEGTIEAAEQRDVAEVFYLDVGLRVSVLRTQIDWLHVLARRIESGALEWPTRPHGSITETATTPTPTSQIPDVTRDHAPQEETSRT
ncbi:PadR family transcriptional regulator [Williamsia sterculiae]|uniref:Transcriptional regulator, PadR family n=1 Tax=Williamsia sterculiae TaxID=1344003 RepID=A0A1N7E1N1_9NOCA|nr:PadR family transcriptional regulator [Williamsia sterculiae]SIR81973.1 transcriptional regulator, PadR family [Williamsia sterculiae]